MSLSDLALAKIRIKCRINRSDSKFDAHMGTHDDSNRVQICDVMDAWK